MKTLDINGIDSRIKLARPKINASVVIIMSLIITVMGYYNVDVPVANTLGKGGMQIVMLLAYTINYALVFGILYIAIRITYPSTLLVKDGKTALITTFITMYIKSNRIKADESPTKLRPIGGLFSYMQLDDPVQVFLECDEKTIVCILERTEYDKGFRKCIENSNDTNNQTMN